MKAGEDRQKNFPEKYMSVQEVLNADTVGKQWLLFDRKMLSDANVTPAQLVQMRRAFYSGAMAMHHLMLIAGQLPEEQAVVKMRDFSTELAEFCLLAMKGQA